MTSKMARHWSEYGFILLKNLVLTRQCYKCSNKDPRVTLT